MEILELELFKHVLKVHKKAQNMFYIILDSYLKNKLFQFIIVIQQQKLLFLKPDMVLIHFFHLHYHL